MPHICILSLYFQRNASLQHIFIYREYKASFAQSAFDPHNLNFQHFREFYFGYL